MTRRYGRTASAPVTSADITRTLRILFPTPVRLRTDTLGPDGQGRSVFVTLMPATSAATLGLHPENTDGTRAGRWLTTHLGRPAEVTAVKYLRSSARGQSACVTVAVTQPGGES